MHDTPTTPTASPPPPVTDRDLQRTALRELVQLASACATEEAEIEQQHAAALASVEKELSNGTWELEQRLKSQADAIEAKYQEKLQSAAAKTASDQAALKSEDAAARRRFDHEKAAVERDVKARFDEAAWLAESVLDAEQSKIREEAQKAKELYESRIEWLGTIDAKTIEAFTRYGATAPPNVPEISAENAPTEEFDAIKATVESRLTAFSGLGLPTLFVGVTPFFALVVLVVLVAAAAQFFSAGTEPDWKIIGIAGGSALVVLLVLGVLLRNVSKNQIRNTFLPLDESVAQARAAADRDLAVAKKQRDEATALAIEKRKAEVNAARNKYAPMLADAARKRDASLQSHRADQTDKLSRIEIRREEARVENEAWHARKESELKQMAGRDQLAVKQRHARRSEEIAQRYASDRENLQTKWTQGLQHIQAPIERVGNNGRAVPDWLDPAWSSWTPPKEFADRVRFGELRVDLQQITDQLPKSLELPPKFSMPAYLAFPRAASLLIHTDHAGRPEAMRTLQMVMTRLLTSLPAGRVRFTLIDPVGLGQNFAGFMHLADHDEALVGSRIWTEREHIEQRLANLTEHMETVIQKYLRNEFETIDEYNAQAGELAEPYRFLVIADFPVGFEGDAFRRLSSIASTGARCGVYTLIVRDTRQTLPAGAHMDELESHSINLVRQGDRFVWKDEIFKQFPLHLDPPPTEDFLTKMMDVVGRYAKEAKRVEVPFEQIAPAEAQWWTGRSSSDLQVPIGRLGATRLQLMKLGRGVAQHVLIAGKTGSGKSTLLHALVTNLAMWYSPDEVELYLIDFKKGVEFKTYATNALPHARAIAVESDREFGLSVLQRLDAELTRRGDLFRKAGVQDLNSYRQAAKVAMPRTLLIIDEFQEFFTEDDKLAQDAGALLDRLVRQGRAFGIHVLLGSQTIGGTSGLSRSTIGQMAVRIALQTSEADSQLILGDNNSAARLLSRPGEAIYNDAGGLVEGNSPFQVAWLPDEQRDDFLHRVQALLAKHPEKRRDPPIVFEGNSAADVAKNHRLGRTLAEHWKSTPPVPLAWLGEPVAIKDPTAVAFRRQSGANVLMVGQQDESAMAMMSSSILSLAGQLPPAAATFYVMDGSAADSPLAQVFAQIKSTIPHTMNLVDYRAVPEAIDAIAKELASRQGSGESNPPAIFLCIYGLQRYRALRRQEENFSFSAGNEEKKPEPDKQFAEILREGPNVGIHVIAWCDTPASVERTLDRHAMREFDNRILFQMSATDSSNLIDSPAANKLGLHRALAYSEEQGVMEKFRPYGLPDRTWLSNVRDALTGQTSP